MPELDLHVGDTVHWKWANGLAEGRVIEIVPERAEIISKGKHLVRNGSPENPAIIMEHSSGNQVIKLKSELLV